MSVCKLILPNLRAPLNVLWNSSLQFMSKLRHVVNIISGDISHFVLKLSLHHSSNLNSVDFLNMSC